MNKKGNPNLRPPLGSAREEIAALMDDCKERTRKQIAQILPHIPPTTVTDSLMRMFRNGELRKIQDKARSRYTRYVSVDAPDNRKIPESLPKIDGSELARCWNISFGRAEIGDEAEV